jgi:hypothetical protein
LVVILADGKDPPILLAIVLVDCLSVHLLHREEIDSAVDGLGLIGVRLHTGIQGAWIAMVT